MIIKPYSSIANETFSASDYPALAHYFPCTSATAANAMTDIAGGLVINDGSNTANTINADYTVTLGTTKSVISSGAVASPGTKAVVIMMAGIPAATSNSCRFGVTTNGTNKGFTLPATAAGAKYCDGTNITTGAYVGTDNDNTVGDGAKFLTRGASFVPGSADGLINYDYDTTGGVWAANHTTPIAIGSTGITTIEQQVNFGPSLRPAFIAVWYFNSLPTDIKAALLWMSEKARLGVKAPYPGWKGKS